VSPACGAIQALPPPETLRQFEVEWPDLVLLEPSWRGAAELAVAIKRRADIPIIALSRDWSATSKIRAPVRMPTTTRRTGTAPGRATPAPIQPRTAPRS
jgi:hypothetical protein